MGTEALNGEGESLDRQIEAMLQDTAEDNNQGGEVAPPEACHQMILHLRGDLLMEAERLKELSEAYYFLCDVLTDGRPIPAARLVMPVEFYKKVSVEPPGIAVSLTDRDGKPTELAMQAVGEAGEAYAACWTRLRDIALRACAACEQLAAQASQPTEALAEGAS